MFCTASKDISAFIFDIVCKNFICQSSFHIKVFLLQSRNIYGEKFVPSEKLIFIICIKFSQEQVSFALPDMPAFLYVTFVYR